MVVNASDGIKITKRKIQHISKQKQLSTSSLTSSRIDASLAPSAHAQNESGDDSLLDGCPLFCQGLSQLQRSAGAADGS